MTRFCTPSPVVRPYVGVPASRVASASARACRIRSSASGRQLDPLAAPRHRDDVVEREVGSCQGDGHREILQLSFEQQ